MASGANNVLYLDFWENYVIPASNQSSVHWRLRLYVAYGVDARMSGEVWVNDAVGNRARVLSYTRPYPSGTWATGNTYTIAEGDVVLSHNSSGTGWLSADAWLRTDTQGSAWSFSKTAAAGFTSTQIIRVPSAPRNLRISSVSINGAVLAVDDPADWGNQRQALLYRVGTTNPPQNGAHQDVAGPGNVATFPPAGGTPLLPNTTYFAVAYAGNSAGWSAPTAAISFVTGSNPPAPPSNITLVLTGTALAPTHTLAWTNNPAAGAPYTEIRVQRAERTGLTGWSNWATIATLAGTATSFVVASAQGPGTRDMSFTYRLVAVNTGGTAPAAITPLPACCAQWEYPTVPADPTNVTAVRGTGGTVDVSWTQPTRLWWATQRIDAWDGTQWVTQATVSRTTTTWNDPAPYAGTTRYRISTVAPVSSTSPYAWTLGSSGGISNNLSVQTEPTAPTQTVPNGIAVDLTGDPANDGAVRFTWRHNPLDGSAQQGFMFRYRAVGDTTWTTVTMVVPDPAAYQQWYDMPGGTLTNGTTYEWQVATRGVYLGADGTSGWSPWSLTAQVVGNGRPIATIVYPLDTSVESIARLTVTWAFFDPEGLPQARWNIVLARWGAAGYEQVETRSGSGTTTSTVFDTLIEDGGAYRITITVTDSAGVVSLPVTSTFSVQYNPPGWVVLDAIFDKTTASIGLSMTPTLWDGPDGGGHTGPGVVEGIDPDGALRVDGDLDPVGDGAVLLEGSLAQDGAVVPDGTPVEVEPATAVDVYRSIDGGPWVLLAEQTSPSASFTDWTPTLEGTNCYRLVVWSDLPSTRVEDPAACVVVSGMRHQTGVLSSGPGFDSPLLLECDLELSTTLARQKETVHLVGRPWPVELEGEALSRVMPVSGVVVGQSAASVRSLMEQALREGIVCWRDLVGNRLFASLGEVTVEWFVLTRPGAVRVSFELTQVEHYE